MCKVTLIVAAAFTVAGIVAATAAPACNGRQATRTGPNGKTLTLCLDGKYSTCIRDSQRLGHSPEAAKRWCDGLRQKGRVSSL
jgi:hypothetical protein